MVKKKTAQGLIALAVLLWTAGVVQARDIFKDVQADVFALGGGSTLVDAQYFDSGADRCIRVLTSAPNLAWALPFPMGSFL